MPEYPVQVSKVQAPPLRDETLARHRLLDWLSAKIHRRAVLLVAEAGYGKTTLLADFTRRTRLRVLWFRLDRGDRDWVGFIAHLVAAFRIHMPEFGPSTRALIAETATTAPSLETVLETFLRELAALPTEPTVFVFDDFHLVDDSVDVRHIARELLARAPERMAFVFASRREPPIRLARLRAMGEVAELGTDDLRFDATETERLFRETYEMRLEPSLVAELGRRTEGWAASLQLVRAALHDRNPGEVRAFISSLSGAEGHLYEYLAEEVIGELPDDLQQFLKRTSILETIDLTLGPIAAEVSVDEAARLIGEGERHGLLGKGAPRARHVVRAHPLVRDYLQARLRRDVGLSGVRDIHSRVARAAEQADWRIAARHYLGAEDLEAVQRVVIDALESVLAMGAYEAAYELASQLPVGHIAGTAGFVIESRLAFRRADTATGLSLAEKGHAADPTSNVALLNLVSARTLAGDVSGAMAANRMLGATAHPSIYAISRAYELTLSASVRGSVAEAEKELRALADRMHAEQQPHYLGVALLNLALQQIARGRAEEALASADEAVEVLATASAGLELVSARLARVGALALAGRIHDARQELDTASKVAPAGQELEVLMESAWTEALFGEAARAHSSVERGTADLAVDVNLGEQAIAARALVRIGVGDLAGARRDVDLFRWGEPTTSMAFEAQRHLFVALLSILEGRPDGPAQAANGTALAHAQGADLWRDYGLILEAYADPTADSSPAVQAVGSRMPVVLSMLAELVVARLAEADAASLETITAEAMRRPWRWRNPVRRALEDGAVGTRLAAIQMLEQIGEAEDVKRLREAGRRHPGKRGVKVGYALARRLAPPVLVNDLGRVQIVRGDTVTEGHTVRRKVLALLCLLLTKPQFVLTRDEVVDSLWPEHDPASAINSLNQTVYFLRRTLEPGYADELSPGYVGQDGETIWLDAELIDCSSRRCLEIIRSMPGQPTAEGAVALATAYTGLFALDFAYEDWATPYRDSLHSGYLRVMEHAVRLDLDSGHLERGIFLAERAAEVEPESDEIHLALTRLYRHSGAHAAAAEQYGHYARAMRELGLDPLPLSEI